MKNSFLFIINGEYIDKNFNTISLKINLNDEKLAKMKFKRV